MPEHRVLSTNELPIGQKKAVKAGDLDLLLIHLESGFVAVEPKCPHAGAPLEQGAICGDRLVCPWHMGTFALPSGALLEPPPMRALTSYPVRVAGDEVFVDSEPNAATPPARQQLATPVILLAGSGAAGAMAATTLRQQGFTGRIIAVDPIADEPVDRTQLTKQALSGKMPLAKTALGTFSTAEVERVQASLVHLSSEHGGARLSDGTSIQFDRALIATGGTPKRLDIPGARFAHVIRHTADVETILKAAEGKREVVVIGTSFIALEAASSLIQKGLQVTVVGKDELAFAKKFGEQVSASVKALHESKGTRFRLGVEIISIDPTGVAVKDQGKDEVIPAELVIMGVGVSPELSFSHDLPLARDGGGIATDLSLRANKNVWVAGDIANVAGTRIEHWRLAEQHGQCAALSMLDEPTTFLGVPFFWTFHFGKRLGYLGHANDWDEIVIDGHVSALDFVALYRKGDKVEAILTCGRDTLTAYLAELMREKPTVAQVRETIGRHSSA